jgi:SAM-dependent methyltransferase
VKFDLDEILDRHVSDKQRANGYAPIYHTIFKHLRDRPLAILEIGIGTLAPGALSSMHGFDHDLPGYRPGASLRAWREYFPNASISGVDVQPDTMIVGEERIVTTLCDSTDAQAAATYLASRPAGFDIIIDDGVHHPELQMRTLRNFYPSLRPNGIFVIEDVQPHGSWASSPASKAEFEGIIGDALYFMVSCRKADIIVISKRNHA